MSVPCPGPFHGGTGLDAHRLRTKIAPALADRHVRRRCPSEDGQTGGEEGEQAKIDLQEFLWLHVSSPALAEEKRLEQHVRIEDDSSVGRAATA